MPQSEVTYVGPTPKGEPSGAFHIDGLELPKGKPQRVDSDQYAELLNELSEGSQRTEYHKFTVEPVEDEADADTQPEG